MKIPRVFLLLALAALPACAVYDAVKDMVKLSAAIAVEFGGQNGVDVSAGKRLLVTLKNSDAANLPPADREQYAHRVAQFVVLQYAKIDSVDTVAVKFMSEHGALGVKVTGSTEPYAWTVRSLRPSLDSARAHLDSAKTR